MITRELASFHYVAKPSSNSSLPLSPPSTPLPPKASWQLRDLCVCLRGAPRGDKSAEFLLPSPAPSGVIFGKSPQVCFIDQDNDLVLVTEVARSSGMVVEVMALETLSSHGVGCAGNGGAVAVTSRVTPYREGGNEEE